MKQKFICKNHDDSLTKHFEIEKILKLLQRKYYWFVCDEQMRAHVKICDVCQRIKISRHKSYEKFKFLSVSNEFWKKIIMNFVTNLSSNKRRDIIYDFIFVMMNRYIKMTKYLSIIVKIDVVELTKFFFENIVARFDMFNEIVSNRKSIFTNVFWSIVCYHAKIKRRLSIAFHFQIDELTEKNNQIFKQYFRIFVDAKQTKWTNLLSITKFVYNNVHHFFAEVSFFYLMYKYHSKIHYEIENNFAEKKI